MKLQISLCFFLLLIWTITGLGCGEDSSSTSVEPGEESEQIVDLEGEDNSQSGMVSGIITNIKTGEPIPGVTISLLGKTVETDAEGRYAFTEIRYSDSHNLIVMDLDYQPKMKKFKLRTEQVQLNVPLSPKLGAVSGVITDGTTGNPIPGATITLLDQMQTTEIDGRYNFTGVPYSQTISLMITAADYQSKTENFELRTGRVGVSIQLMPTTNPETEIPQFLERFSALIESLDIGKLKTIQELFSETYVAGDDPITLLGLATGVIPAMFDDVNPTITKVFGKYDALQFEFNKIQVEVTNTRKASARLTLHIISEEGAGPDKPRAEKREIIVDCQIDFRKEDTLWKIVFWQLFNVEFL